MVDDYWSSDRVDYLIAWLECAEENGFDIAYLGAANESGADRDTYVALRKALDDNGYEDVRVVASDNHSPPNYWFVAEQMQDDQEFADAVDVLGEHDVCVWRTEQRTCHVSEAALALDKPLWDSENSTQDYVVGNAVALVGGGLALAGWGGGALVAVAAAGLLVQVALLGYESVFVRAAQDVPLS